MNRRVKMKLVRYNRKQRLVLLLVTLSITSLFFASINVDSVYAQAKDNKERIIKKTAWGNEPIEIVSLKNNQKSIKIDEIFVQDTKWLEDFTIKYKNNSGNTIIWLSIGLDFPETRATGNVMSFPLTYGINPLLSITAQERESIKPGESVEIPLTSKKYDALKRFIEKRHQLDSLNQVKIRVEFILFEDGTGWSSGNFLRPDPKNSRRWIPVDSKK
jgi:hypothetical protein